MHRTKWQACRLLGVLVLTVGCQGPPAKAVFAPGLTQQGFAQVRAGMTKPDVEALIGSPLSRSEPKTAWIYPLLVEGTREEVEVAVWFDSDGRLTSDNLAMMAALPGFTDLRLGATMREVEAVLGLPIDRHRYPELEAWYYSRQGWVWDAEVYVLFGEEDLVTEAGIDFGDITRYQCESEVECPTVGEVESLGYLPGALYPRPVLGWWPLSVYRFERPSTTPN